MEDLDKVLQIYQNLHSTFEYVYYFVLVLLAGLGIYSFINLRVWEDMFLMNDFKFFNYEQSLLLFYLKYLLVLITIALVIYVIYVIFSFVRKVKNIKVKN